MFQVGDGLKTIQQIESRTPADTDYIELSLAGLEDAKTVINQIGNIVSSSCIPSQCLAGGDGLRQETYKLGVITSQKALVTTKSFR